MSIKPIKSDSDYHDTLKEIEKIFDATKDTKLGDKLELLTILVEDYERKHFPIDNPDPIEAIKFRMEQLGITVKELGEIIGYTSRASEILHHKRKLTLNMIRKISQGLHIPVEILIKEYSLTQ